MWPPLILKNAARVLGSSSHHSLFTSFQVKNCDSSSGSSCAAWDVPKPFFFKSSNTLPTSSTASTRKLRKKNYQSSTQFLHLSPPLCSCSVSPTCSLWRRHKFSTRVMRDSERPICSSKSFDCPDRSGKSKKAALDGGNVKPGNHVFLGAQKKMLGEKVRWFFWGADVVKTESSRCGKELLLWCDYRK